MRKIKDLRHFPNLELAPTVQTIQLDLDSQSNEPLTVVYELVPGKGNTGLQHYINEDHISVRVKYMGSFTPNGTQTIIHSYVPNGSPIASGPLLQGTYGYLKIKKEQLPLVLEVFDRGDYIAIKPWNSDIYLGEDSKGRLMLVMNLLNKEEIQLVAVPGGNYIPPMPSGDGRTKGFKQLQNGIHNGVKPSPSAPVKRYTHTYVTDADMPSKYVHQPGDKLGF